ncbi:unnamed protein product, partial [Onchocerca ochengi]
GYRDLFFFFDLIAELLLGTLLMYPLPDIIGPSFV